MGLIERYKFKRYVKKWRKVNEHNETFPVNYYNQQLVTVGRWTYGELCVLTFNDYYKLQIGNFCSIAPDVVFVLSADHFLTHVSSFPFKVKMIEKNGRNFKRRHHRW